MAVYGLYVRDSSRTRVAEIDDFSELILTRNWNDVGTWRITMPVSSLAAQALTFGGGIVVVRDGLTLLSGPVRQLTRTYGAEGDVVLAQGPDDLTLLKDEVAVQVPSTTTGNYTAAAQDIFPVPPAPPGPAETVIKHFVDVNIGPAATPVRRRDGLTLGADLARGTAVVGRARMQNLLTFVQELATAGSVSFALVQQVTVGGFPLQFDCYIPRNQTGIAVFSPKLGTLGAYHYTQGPPDVNYVIAGGSGELTARIFQETWDQASLQRYGRIARFIDRRDTTDVGELQQAMRDALAQGADKTEWQLTPIDTPGMQFGVAYGLGDRVTIDVDGTLIQDVVRSVTIRLDKDRGETITPYVGTPALADQAVPALFRKLGQLTTRVGNLERR